MEKGRRTLYCLADNYAENKNNTLFAFCSELVMRGFGPVGHTHNGNDAVHYIHNQIAGNFVSITPAELFNNYDSAWKSERTRPTPIINELQYAWTARYRDLSDRVGGFTNVGTRDPKYVRAFKFTLNAAHLCEMQIKGSPSSPVWHGVDSAGSSRVHLFETLPIHYPQPKRPTDFKMDKRY